MRVSARTEESLRPIFLQENAILGWTVDRLPSFSWPITMNDLIFAGIVTLFFVISALYVRFCDHL
jgi:hypothetical protein